MIHSFGYLILFLAAATFLSRTKNQIGNIPQHFYLLIYLNRPHGILKCCLIIITICRKEISPSFTKYFSHMPQSFLSNVVQSIWTNTQRMYTQIFKRDVSIVKGEHVTLLNVIVVWYNVNPCENLGRCLYVIYRLV